MKKGLFTNKTVQKKTY